jgi:hypothetical protein
MELHDHSSLSKNVKGEITELTRLARALKAEIHNKNWKPQGRKKIHTTRPAKYHNWHTLFCWSQILLAVKEVGWRMGASDIRALKRRDKDTFAGITRSTVNEWIDWKGKKPKWTAAVLKKVERGNNPGHNKGGRQGILVCLKDL